MSALTFFSISEFNMNFFLLVISVLYRIKIALSGRSGVIVWSWHASSSIWQILKLENQDAMAS